MINKVPNPGSSEAVERGCICPRIDNGHGRGAYGGAAKDEQGNVQFWIAQDCPLHDRKEWK